MKHISIPEEKLILAAEKFGTPFHIYDEAKIRQNARDFLDAFSWNKGFKEFFAVKACPNPFMMKILQEEGIGADCSSLPELALGEKIGLNGNQIMFSSNNTPADEYKKAFDMGAIINLDDISHIPFLEKHAGIPEVISFRFNPGPERTGNVIIGNPSEAKYGMTKEQLFEAYKIMEKKGVKSFGLHTMVASNELNIKYHIETARMMFTLAQEIRDKGYKLDFVNLGGGIGIPYRPDEKAVDLKVLSAEVKKLFDQILTDDIDLFYECGRIMTGPFGYLVAKVRHLKETYKDYVGLDACMADLMRPAIYGAYHHITVLGKDGGTKVYDVTGSLCENNDKFAIDRELPKLERDDVIVIHDTGAHGYAMGFNYNGKLRSKEILYRSNGEMTQIRRAETMEDYFSTLDFKGLTDF